LGFYDVKDKLRKKALSFTIPGNCSIRPIN